MAYAPEKKTAFAEVTWSKEDFEKIMTSFRLPLSYAKMLEEYDTIFVKFHPGDHGNTHGRFGELCFNSPVRKERD